MPGKGRSGFKLLSGPDGQDDEGEAFSRQSKLISGEGWTPEAIGALHNSSDVDSSQQSQHHTLGPRHTQSSPGDHTHNGTSSKSLGVWSTYLVSWATVGLGANPVLGSGKLIGRYAQIGGTVFGRLIMSAASDTTFGTGPWIFSKPPVPSVPALGLSGNQYEGGVGAALASNGSANFSGTTTLQPTSSARGIVSVDMWIDFVQILGDNMLWGGGSSSPWTWTTTSGLQAHYFYEVNPL